MLDVKEKETIFRDYYNSVMSMDSDHVLRKYDDTGLLNEGYPLLEHIKYDIEQYKTNHKHFKLYPDSNYDVVHMSNYNNRDYFSVINSDGDFVFEIPIVINENGKLIPNNSSYNVVPKTLFIDSSMIKRQIALWCPLDKKNPTSVIPKGITTENNSLTNSSSYEDDGFKNFSFTIPDDDYSTKHIKFSVYGSRSKELCGVRFCGKNHPYFIDNNFPNIYDNSVELINKGILFWSLSVYLDDGTNVYLPFPKAETLYFNKRIIKVILTDALDNDWEVVQ